MAPSEFAGRLFIVVAWVSVTAALIASSLDVSIPYLDFEPLLIGVALLLAAISFVVGRAICEYKNWGRVAGIVLGIVMLPFFFLGTFLGALILWCLTKGLRHERLPPIWEIGLLVASLLLAGLTSVGAFVTVPQFAQLFAGFDADLPALTDIVLKYYSLTLALPLLVVAAWKTAPGNRDLAVVGTAIAVSAVAQQLLVVGLYLPILKLGALVQ